MAKIAAPEKSLQLLPCLNDAGALAVLLFQLGRNMSQERHPLLTDFQVAPPASTTFSGGSWNACAHPMHSRRRCVDASQKEVVKRARRYFVDRELREPPKCRLARMENQTETAVLGKGVPLQKKMEDASSNLKYLRLALEKWKMSVMGPQISVACPRFSKPWPPTTSF